MRSPDHAPTRPGRQLAGCAPPRHATRLHQLCSRETACHSHGSSWIPAASTRRRISSAAAPAVAAPPATPAACAGRIRAWAAGAAWTIVRDSSTSRPAEPKRPHWHYSVGFPDSRTGSADRELGTARPYPPRPDRSHRGTPPADRRGRAPARWDSQATPPRQRATSAVTGPRFADSSTASSIVTRPPWSTVRARGP